MVFAIADLIFDPLRRIGKVAAQAIERQLRDIKEDSVLVKTQTKVQNNGDPEKFNESQASEKESRGQTPKTEYNPQRASDVSFWLRYICLEFPARNVAHAFYLLKEEKRRSPRIIGAIILGIVMCPAFAVAWLIQQMICQASYLIELISTWFQAGFS